MVIANTRDKVKKHLCPAGKGLGNLIFFFMGLA
jgi:hypothetical protein